MRARLIWMSLAAVMAAPLAGCGGGGCETAADCDQAAATAGQVCAAGKCVACTADPECWTDHGPQSGCAAGVCLTCTGGTTWDPAAAACVGGANCVPGAAGSILAACEEQHRQCAVAGDTAACGDCLGGYQDDAGTCAAQTCVRGVPGSLFEACRTEQRLCVEEDGPAACGECVAGYLEDTSGGAPACRAVATCAALGCVARNRSCLPAGAHTDAVCGECLAGTIEQLSSCIPRPGAVCDPADTVHTIAPACQGANRYCVDSAAGASCGDCVPGFVINTETGLCDTQRTCAELDCAGEHRACEDLPNAHCTTCLTGYVLDSGTGACRPVRTCADITCDASMVCQEAFGNDDAFCHPPCATDEIWVAGCRRCNPCGGDGETGEVWPVASASGHCICATRPGYFYADSGDIGTYACDADGDGWLRESARVSMESLDSSVRANARCPLRVIDRFILHNLHGESLRIGLTSPLGLYESDRNDDQQLLDLESLPGYGNGARKLKAAELNRLTKACSGADYNDNGWSDAEEYAEDDLATGFDPRLKPFNEFAYFIELHRGWFEEPASGENHGSYHIREKRRAAEGSDPVEIALRYPDAEQAQAAACELWPDPQYQTTTPSTGNDFARFVPETLWDKPRDYGFFTPPGPVTTWFGMNLHSQYKCLQLVNDNDPLLGADHPQKKSLGMLEDIDGFERYRMNSCAAEPTSQPPIGGIANPDDPDLTCSLSASPAIGDVGWAVVRYKPWYQEPQYQGGCLGLCPATRGRCGTCGLGTWQCTAAGPLCTWDAAAGKWWFPGATSGEECGDFGTPAACADVALPASWNLAALDCNDQVSASSFVYVATPADGGDDATGDGSRTRPYGTITYALLQAKQRGALAVIAGSGTYDERVVLQDGVALLGGFLGQKVGGDAEAAFVRGTLTDYVTRIAPTVPDEHDRIVSVWAENLTTPTLLDRITIAGGPAGVDLGTSNYGLYATSAPGLQLNDVKVQPDAGAAGVASLIAASGTAGRSASAATGATNPDCAADTSGGNGGAGINNDGLAGAAPLGGAGGLGELGVSEPTDGWGRDGQAGARGAKGTASAPGVWSSGFWVASPGGDGAAGVNGGGGGGGGWEQWSTTAWGAGGGGGAGGCGGRGGNGGGAGGSSIAMVAIDSTGLTIAGTTWFTAGNGGYGGKGEDGGFGGEGGYGGPTAAAGGNHNGGRGGSGGRGGHGAGGGGGSSIGVYCVSTTIPGVTGKSSHGNAGVGGLGGGQSDPGFTAPNGPNGMYVATVNCP